MNSMQLAKPRWERLGLSAISCQERLDRIVRDFEWEGRYVDKISPPALPSQFGRDRDLLLYYDILQLRHLEWLQVIRDAEVTLGQMSKLAVDYFCGAWRDSLMHDGVVLDRQGTRTTFEWFDPLRLGLVASLLLRGNEDLRAIVDFVGPDLRRDDGAWDRTKDDNQFYCALAAFIREGNLSGCKDVVSQVAKSRSRRPRMMVACLVSIASASRDRFATEFAGVVKLFRDFEFAGDQGRVVASWDATVLWNLACMRGLDPHAASDELMDFVITRSSLGLSK